MNETPVPINVVPTTPVTNTATNNQNLTNVNQIPGPEVSQQPTLNKGIKISPKIWLSLISLGFIVVAFIAAYIYYQNLLVIDDQPLSSAITIKKLFLLKGGSLAIDQSDAPSNYLLATGYLAPGTYKDFAVGYQTSTLMNTPQQKFYTARAFIFEDSNNNQKFDSNTDIIAKNVFGVPFIKYFKLENVQPKPTLCLNGFSDNFSEELLDKTKWNAYILNKLENGHLVQTVKDTNSTILYSKDNFSGDVQIEATISSFNINPDTSDYRAINELEMFTPFDRVISVRWNKTSTESYLTPQISKNKDQPSDRFDVPRDGSINLKIVRQGSVATVYLANPDGVFQQLWQLQDVSRDDVSVGFETYNLASSSSILTSTVSSFSVSCPSN